MRGFCPRCGARLRRGQPLGAWCDPCLRSGPDPARDLPPDFYAQPRVCAALAVYDFGLVFRALRRRTGWSQQMLGAVVDLEQSQVSAIERGNTRLGDIRRVARVAQGLRIPGHLLGFPDHAQHGNDRTESADQPGAHAE